MKGILGAFHNIVSGDANRHIFNTNAWFGAGTPGGGWANYLTNLYKTPTTESDVFKMQSGSLRDLLSQESTTQGNEFSQATNAGGFYDSGARLQGLNDINRNKMMSYSQGLTQILTNLEHEKMTAAFPFLSAQNDAFNSYYNQIAKTQDEQNFRGAQLGQAASSVGGAFAGGGK